MNGQYWKPWTKLESIVDSLSGTRLSGLTAGLSYNCDHLTPSYHWFSYNNDLKGNNLLEDLKALTDHIMDQNRVDS